MKITKEMAAEMRAGALDAMESKMIPGSSTELLINPLVLLAVLDERKALRVALDQACGEITNWRHKEAVAALALGEDEE